MEQGKVEHIHFTKIFATITVLSVKIPHKRVQQRMRIKIICNTAIL